MTEANVVAGALDRVVEELSTARRLLDEAYSIGLWSKSDDCSDNRRKRQCLRETDWAISGALRALNGLPAPVDAIARDLRALVAVVEPLPDTVTDTMGTNGELDATISRMSDEVDGLSKRAARLSAELARFDQFDPSV